MMTSHFRINYEPRKKKRRINDRILRRKDKSMEKENEQKRDSFIFYRSFYEAIHELDFEDQCSLYEAIFEYQFNGYEIEFDGINKAIKKAIWSLIKPQLDANNQRYESGKKGGAPKGNTNATKQKNNQKQPMVVSKKQSKTTTGCFLKTTKNNQKQPNVNDNVNENVNENEKQKQNENGNEIASATATTTKTTFEDLDPVKNYLDNINPMPTPIEAELLESYMNDTPPELINYAIEKAVERKARSMRIYKSHTKCLENKRHNNIKRSTGGKQENE